MSEGQKLLKLIEELVEVKLQMHVGYPVGAKPEIAQLLAKKRHDDRHRLDTVRQQIVALIDG